MKKLLLLFVLLWTSLVHAAPAYVQSGIHATSSPTTTNTLTLTFTANNFFVAVARSNSAATITIADNKSDVFLLACSTPSITGIGVENIYYVAAAVGGSTTITQTNSTSNYLVLIAGEYSGLAASYILEGCGINSGTGSGLTSGTVITSTSNELLIGIINSGGSTLST